MCAIGLRVPDPQAALSRARQLQFESFSQPVGPGEYQIPALRGVGGSLLYLMDESETPAIWKTEFEELPREGSHFDAGLERIDYFSQSMQYEEMLSWLLYYVTLFQVDKSRGDRDRRPRGSRAEPGDPIERTEFPHPPQQLGVWTDARGSLPACVRRRGRAACLVRYQRHLCHCRAAARARQEFLPIPENYYYDLGARFGLEDAVLSRMAEFNILYDEDERGTYHHLYTRAFAKRFFFEVVQRHRYDGYGARDTSIRLAAQSRFRNLTPGTDIPPLHPAVREA